MSRLVALILFPDFQILDAAGPIAAFEIAGRFAGEPYGVQAVAERGGQTVSSSGVALIAAPFAALHDRPIDTLIAVGGVGVDAQCERGALAAFVREAAPRARRTASVCSGALILAQAGLLDGRRAATHWNRAAGLQRAYPAVRVEPDAIFVKDGPVWTSAGISAGVDLALAMIEEDHGEAVARRTAEMLVVYHRRPAGQSQFSTLLEVGRSGGRFDDLNRWIRENLTEKLTVERLAEQAGMSARNFARVYAAETGYTPAKAVERFRTEAAAAMIRSGADRVEQAALRTGFVDPERMRRAFLRAFGQPPQALRRAARATPSARES